MDMEFVRTESRKRVEKLLLERLSTELSANKRVLWLLSGGSNIPISVAVMQQLPEEETKNLAIFMMDERYGEVGHLNSNAQQLMDGGFRAKNAVFIHTLMPGFSLEETRERFEAASKRAFEHADVILAQIGIGSDGHIAGILPNSPAASDEGWVCAYDTPTYKRVTLTFTALRQVTVAIAAAFGDEKKATLVRLRDENLALTEQPAQLLKELSEAYVCNDQVGGNT